MSKFKNLIFLFILSIPNLSYGFSNSKDWCLPQNKYQRNIPFHKLEDGNKCPSNTKQISQERALNLFLTNYDGYLNQIIVSGTICNDTYKNYKYLRELIREEKNLDCNRIKAELLKKN